MCVFFCFLKASLIPKSESLSTCYISSISGTTTTAASTACATANTLGGGTTYSGCQVNKEKKINVKFSKNLKYDFKNKKKLGVTSAGAFLHTCIAPTAACVCGSTTLNSVSVYIKSAQCAFTTDLAYTAYCSNAQSFIQSFSVLMASILLSFGL